LVPFAAKAIVELSRKIVAGPAGRLLTFRTLLNQMKLFSAIAVPLKFDPIVPTAGQVGSVRRVLALP
jgi:hypothetical protein